jgi:hypothetical protein
MLVQISNGLFLSFLGLLLKIANQTTLDNYYHKTIFIVVLKNKLKILMAFDNFRKKIHPFYME